MITSFNIYISDRSSEYSSTCLWCVMLAHISRFASAKQAGSATKQKRWPRRQEQPVQQRPDGHFISSHHRLHIQ